MKIHRAVILGCLLLVVPAGCDKNLTSLYDSKPETTYTAADQANLPALSSLAVDLSYLAKSGALPQPPYVAVNETAVAIEYPDRNRWRERNVMIIEAGTTPAGSYRQRMLVESVDQLGRIDLRDEQITFQIREPSPSEAELIAGDAELVMQADGEISAAAKQDPEGFRERLKRVQAECGLEADGVFGKNTAGCIGRRTPITELEALTSTVVYPQSPRLAVYVVPRPVVDQNPEQFYQGFDSFETVRQAALDQARFGEQAVEGACFVAFVYFFDRVIPGEPVSLRVSPYQRKFSGAESQSWYVEPGTWPVVVEDFTIDESAEDELYLNVYFKSGWSKRCIASQRLQ